MSLSLLPLLPLGARPVEPDEALAEYRIARPAELRALLRQCLDAQTPLTLAMPQGHTLTTPLWGEDAERGVLVFPADPADGRVQALLAANEAVAVGYLDQVKIQFDLQDLMLVHGRDASALQARYPSEIFRFQRRDSFRVRPVGLGQPRLRLGGLRGDIPPLTLRVLDLSHSGLAAVLQEPVPGLSAGRVLEGVTLELDAATRLTVQLRIVHAAPLPAEGWSRAGWRLGCELKLGDALGVRLLQRFLESTQIRSRERQR
jgi:flagellar brake protein